MQSLKVLRNRCTALGHCWNQAQLLKLPCRSSGNYKRPQFARVPHDQLEQLKANIFQCRTDLSPAEWQATQQTLINNYRHITASNVDAVIVGLCNEAHQLPLAKDYVQHMRTSGLQPNAATLGRLLRVYNAAYHGRGGGATALTTAEQQEILEICAALRQQYEVLDATSCESLIHGLVATPQWTQARELLAMMRLSGSVPTVTAYTELTVKAFAEGELALGWQLLEEQLSERKQPKCEALIAYLETISKDVSTFSENLEKFLLFLEKHQLPLTAKVVACIEDIAERLHRHHVTVASAQLNRLGKCSHCGSYMQQIAVSDEEFGRLRDSFLNKVLIRRDVFQKSTPEEVERFERFVSQTAPYDCVVDGLNVAYSLGAKKPPHVLANLLASVVKHFSVRNKHVLVLGRKHMNNWPKDAMQYVRKLASIFLTNNLTHDDPFLLYATLKSGRTTDFFSRDLMRSHAFLLGSDLKAIFRRWQQEHQYSLLTQTDSGKIIVKEPIRHLISAHKVEGTWHLPCKQEFCANPPETFEMPEKWLCLKIKS